MPLSPGSRLGPYEVVGAIGAGGMGEVYRARDTRLERTVAIKVLPPALAANAEFRERFEREAKSISALNHVNICTVHDVGRLRPEGASASQEAIDFLVLEYLEGETLAERLLRGPLALPDALRVAIEVASALERAHRQGIVHRDLKPGNVMLAKTGTGSSPPIAKLLDFGLAKSGALTTSAATVTTMAPITAQGTILGTFQYMAPEQIEGEEADARTDIFAFGALLFEMVTGRKAFEGKSQPSLLSAILKDDPPPVSQVQPIASPALDYLIRTCLAKDRDARFQTSHDLLLQLKWIAEGGSSAGVPAPVAVHRRRREQAAWLAAAVLAVGLVGTLAWNWMSQPTSAGVAGSIEFAIPVDDPSVQTQATVSPDGRTIAYLTRPEPGAPPIIVLRTLNDTTPQVLRGTEGAAQLFWSPDGRSIGFVAAQQLKRVDLAGGLPRTICDIPENTLASGATWGRGDVIVFTAGTTTLYRVAAGGGTPVKLPVPEGSPPVAGRWPSFLPDGRHFLYLKWTATPSERAIVVASLDELPGRTLFSNEFAAQYAPPGFILFQRQGSLFAQRFDAGSFALSGEPILVEDDLAFNTMAGRGAFGVSDSGVLVFRGGGAMIQSAELAWFDRSGKPIGEVSEPGLYHQIRLSPDDRQIAFSRPDVSAGKADVWTTNLSSGVTSRLTYHASNVNDPVWGPDSRTVAYFASDKGVPDFYRQTLGSREVVPIFESPDMKYPHDWSSDGQFLLFHLPRRLMLVSLADGKARELLSSPGSVDSGRFAPDSRAVAYGSNQSGVWEIYLASLPDFKDNRQISKQGGGQPRWRGDGRELFYLDPAGRVMSVTVTTTTTASRRDITTSAPTALFPSPLLGPNPLIDEYDVTRDGQRFLFIRSRAGASTAPLIVRVNWTAGLK